MRFDSSPPAAPTQENIAIGSTGIDRGKRRKTVVAGSILIVAAVALMPGTAAILANDGPSQKMAAIQERDGQFDWILQNRQTLANLKENLNLTSAQLTAWDIWSAGVIKDSQQQLERKGNQLDETVAAKDWSGGTTPERMARGIERLRMETVWMQEYLSQLEACQVRTNAFYGALDIRQKTIFDLFWHEMHRRVTGHDLRGNLPGHRYRPPVI